MVRGLGVSHKSLLVPDVTEGTYAIRFEHAEYLDKDFNITVGSELPTTFSEAMAEKVYAMTGHTFYGTNLLDYDNVIIGDTATAAFTIENTGNVPAQAHYVVLVAGTSFLSLGDTSVLNVGETSSTISVPIYTSEFTLGLHTVSVDSSAKDHNVTSTLAQNLYVAEWTADITFIATAPGISDLHGVEVFIDDISMGTT